MTMDVASALEQLQADKKVPDYELTWDRNRPQPARAKNPIVKDYDLTTDTNRPVRRRIKRTIVRIKSDLGEWVPAYAWKHVPFDVLDVSSVEVIQCYGRCSQCVATPTPLPDEVYAMLSKVRTAVLEMRFVEYDTARRVLGTISLQPESCITLWDMSRGDECPILQHSLVVNCRKLIYIVKSDYKFRRALRGMLDADHVTLCVNPSPKLMRLVKEIVETYSKEQAGRARFLGDGPETRYELCYEFENVDRDAPGRTNQSRSIFVKHAYPFAYPTYFRAYIIGNDKID